MNGLVRRSQLLNKLAHSEAGEYWARKAYDKTNNRGKQLHRDGFGLAEERYGNASGALSVSSNMLYRVL
jgi:hypothetical protein